MRNDYKEMQGQLNALADWIEKSNNVHADSLPRRAAYTIAKLEEENYQMRLLLNKKDVTIMERLDRFIGRIKLYIYLAKLKWKKN
jgi:hypothetical protein